MIRIHWDPERAPPTLCFVAVNTTHHQPAVNLDNTTPPKDLTSRGYRGTGYTQCSPQQLGENKNTFVENKCKLAHVTTRLI